MEFLHSIQSPTKVNGISYLSKESIFLILFLVLLGTFIQTSFADSVSVDKEKYQFGETINVSGRVSYVEDSFVGLQILNPSKSDIVVIDQFFPQKDGKFSKNYKAQGPKWNEEGFYHLKLVYNHEVFEKQFFFEKPMNANPDKGISSEPKEESIPAKSETQNDGDEKTSKHDLKLIVKNFPDPSKPPSHYLDRYYSERAYQDWFDSVFKENSIIEVVGFGSTHVQGFPDNTKSAWHYVNRYHNEESYRDWFDSEFPSKSIFEVLGYPESLFQRVPDWIKNNAKWWSEGLITDRDFLKGIEYLIIEKIIFIPDLPEPGNSSTKTIPEWIKNTAKWWSEGKIDENEFLNGITFLIENKIITV